MVRRGRKLVEAVDGKKKCSQCKEFKSLEEFQKKITGPLGVTSKCKECTSENKKAAYVSKEREDRSLLDEKECAKCHEVKSRSEFRVEKRGASGMTSRCRDCMKEDERIKRGESVKTEYAVLLEQNLKRCLGCDETKSLDGFYKRSDISSGVQSRCKECVESLRKEIAELEKQIRLEGEKELQEEWNSLYPNQRMCSVCAEIKDKDLFRCGENTPTRIALQCLDCTKEVNKEYYTTNFETISERKKSYYQNNKEQMLEYSSQHYQENRDLRLAQNAEWRKNNYQLYLEIQRRSVSKRRAIIANIPNTFPRNWWQLLLEFYGHKCANSECEKEINSSNPLTHDHVIPLSWESSSNSMLNSQVLCKSCNSTKKNFHSTDYRDWSQGIIMDDLTTHYDKIDAAEGA